MIVASEQVYGSGQNGKTLKELGMLDKAYGRGAAAPESV